MRKSIFVPLALFGIAAGFATSSIMDNARGSGSLPLLTQTTPSLTVGDTTFPDARKLVALQFSCSSNAFAEHSCLWSDDLLDPSTFQTAYTLDPARGSTFRILAYKCYGDMSGGGDPTTVSGAGIGIGSPYVGACGNQEDPPDDDTGEAYQIAGQLAGTGSREPYQGSMDLSLPTVWPTGPTGPVAPYAKCSGGAGANCTVYGEYR